MKVTKKLQKRKTKINKKVIIIFAAILLLLILLNLWIKKADADKQLKLIKAYNSLDDFTAIQEVATYMDCKYIKQQKSKTQGYSFDIYMEIKVAPYTDNISNQNFYERLLLYCAKTLNYENFTVIDDKKELAIGVICNKDDESISTYYINGIQNYFEIQDSKNAVNNFKQEKTTQFNIESKEIQQLINKKWQSKEINFGTVDSTINNYDIYFDEGIQVRKIGTKVFNIVFNQNYKNSVINNIGVKTTKEEIIKQLGEPTYTDSVTKLIGYKGEKIYILFNFSLNQISIYNIEENFDTEKVAQSIKQYSEGSKDLKTFISEVKKIWPDFDKYTYDSNYVELQYTLKGMKIQYNIAGKSGVTIYSNYDGKVYGDITIKNILNKETEIPKGINIKFENLVVEQEKDRIATAIEKIQQAKLNANSNNTYGIIKAKPQNSIVEIISLDGNGLDKELKEYVDYGIWLDDNNYAYSISQKGIYVYNINTKIYKTIITNTEDKFELKGYKNNELKYDNKSVIVNL